jgi:hypothetical protein
MHFNLILQVVTTYVSWMYWLNNVIHQGLHTLGLD